MTDSVSFYEGYNIRRFYDEESEMWFFSIVDVVQALTDSTNPTDYLKKLRKRDPELGGYVGTNCPQIAMTTSSGKKRNTLAGNVQHILRIIQSITSPKVEPLKKWLAKVGYERMQELTDPSLSVNRGREMWQKHGRSEKWIQQRMMGQETRNKLTDYWKDHEVREGKEFALLTNIIHQEWAGLTVKEHKKFKALKSQNLRDHMSEAELIFTALAELSTRQIAEVQTATGLEQNKRAGKQGGGIARKARVELEEKIGRSLITNENYLPPKTSENDE
ncbi:BRO family protein [Dyadobacter sp. CY343]|uniref:BRO family protein n=1 Tax=Dyadobacter sp. CY343 TaxID=2907299 RepID=UPI001F350E33|nr:BRO family protein [Dyadobacter sp. CY343]MCE7062116.1 hypothetical protein [Dyadobacter sp. CY343]